MATLSKLEILTAEDIERIHELSINILSTSGIFIPHEKMLDLFKESGALVNKETQIVKIPGKLVEYCLKSCGKQFIISGRDNKKQARFGYGNRNYNTIAGEAMWLDHRTGKRRFPRLEDVAAAARVADALPHINIAGAMADPHDCPADIRCIEVTAALIKNTTKPVTFWFHDRNSAKYIMELFSAAAGGTQTLKKTPLSYAFLEPISPLKYSFNGIDLLFETGKIPLPVSIGPMDQTGTTAPGTLAGTILQENAEILSGICLVQLICEGTPVCYGGIPHAFDMKTTQMIFAGPEQNLMAAAMVQMGKYYGLPVYINVGLTDSKIPDAQAGLEAGMTLLSGVLAGADIFGHMGICGVDQAASLPMAVLQDEIISYVEKIAEGFEINEEKLGFDVITSVGPGGNYLEHEHTLKNFRQELWFPKLLDRNFFEVWDREGRLTMEERIMDHLENILKNHEVDPIDKNLEEEIDRIVSHANKRA